MKMEYNEAKLMVGQAIDAMERKQIEIGNDQFKHAYIVGALTALISTTIATGSTTKLIEFLQKQIVRSELMR